MSLTSTFNMEVSPLFCLVHRSVDKVDFVNSIAQAKHCSGYARFCKIGDTLPLSRTGNLSALACKQALFGEKNNKGYSACVNTSTKYVVEVTKFLHQWVVPSINDTTGQKLPSSLTISFYGLACEQNILTIVIFVEKMNKVHLKRIKHGRWQKLIQKNCKESLCCLFYLIKEELQTRTTKRNLEVKQQGCGNRLS